MRMREIQSFEYFLRQTKGHKISIEFYSFGLPSFLIPQRAIRLGPKAHELSHALKQPSQTNVSICSQGSEPI